jgi:MFS transporter, putative metabolite:H+ symporter
MGGAAHGTNGLLMALPTSRRAIYLAVLVAALGYFVDIYDLILFSVVRVESLKSLGLTGEAITDTGVFLFNMQLIGMLVGGFVWGVLGDKLGRLSVLFGSIILYSLANILNGMVTSVDQYAVLRFIAGIGLAGELGAGVTLVAELMPAGTRGYGTTIIASVGLCGGIIAGFMGSVFPWRTSYYVGGAMGLMLLLLRLGVVESGMFDRLKGKSDVRRGDFRQLFATRERAFRYAAVILIGVPIWYVFGVLVTLAPEVGKSLGLDTAPSSGVAVRWAYFGIAAGDVVSGVLSQVWRSRRNVIALFIVLTALSVAAYFVFGGASPSVFYLMCALAGFGTGYWAVFVTSASEQFGTNLRATVTTTVPNLVRGSGALCMWSFVWFKHSLGVRGAALAVGVAAFVLAGAAVSVLKETYGKDLDFLES